LAAIVLVVMAAAQAQTGPKLPAAERVFDVLDLRQPELVEIKRLHEAGDDQGACRALHKYIRSTEWHKRTAGTMPSRRDPNYSDPVADDLLKNVFNLGPFKVCWGPKVSDITWYEPPMHVIDDVHLFYGGTSMTRHSAFMGKTAMAYWHTHDERFAAKLVEIVLDFVERCPIVDSHGIGDNELYKPAADQDGDGQPDRPGACAGMVWQPFNIGRRVQAWRDLFVFCRDSESVTPQTSCEVLCSIDEQVSSLVEKLPPMRNASNHTTRMGKAILEICDFWPELAGARAWRCAAIGKLAKAYNWVGDGGFIYPDGALTEIKVSMGEVRAVADIIETARLHGIAVPRRMLAVHAEMAEFAFGLLWPGHVRSGRFTETGRRIDALHDRKDLLYIATGGREGRKPDFISWPPRSGEPSYAGTYLMRSGWGGEAMVVRTRFGPMRYSSPNRGSGSMGEISVLAHDMHLIPFIGHSEYRGEFTSYGNAGFRGDGRSRNTISVDGVGQTKYGRIRVAAEPMSNPWITCPVFDYVRGAYTFDPAKLSNVKITHTRSIFFARPDYCVVIDRLAPDDEREHEYRMKYQLNYLLDPHAEAARVTAVSNAAGIVVEPLGSGITLSIIKGQKKPYYEGWHYARGFRPAPALVYTWKTKGVSCVQTLLCPLAAGANGARKVRASAERAGNGAVVLTITGHEPNTTDYLLIGGENRICRGGGHGLNGDLAFIRKSGDEIVAAGMVDGTSLTGEAPVFTFETPTSAWAQRQPDGTWRRSTDGPLVE